MHQLIFLRGKSGPMVGRPGKAVIMDLFEQVTVFFCRISAGQDVDIIHKPQSHHSVCAPRAVLHQIRVEEQEEDGGYGGALRYTGEHPVGGALPSTQY